MTRRLKHLPLNEWPDDDREAFALLFEREGDLFDDNGPLSHVSPATERAFIHSYRRWLGFLTAHHQQLLSEPPGDRVTPATVEAYGRHLQKTCNPHSTADQITKLHLCIRKLAPQRDWGWIARLCARLRISAGRRPSRPHIFVTSAQTFDFGIRLMEEAWQVFHVSGERSKNTLMNYRDGMVIAMLSNCPIRRGLSNLEKFCRAHLQTQNNSAEGSRPCCQSLLQSVPGVPAPHRPKHTIYLRNRKFSPAT